MNQTCTVIYPQFIKNWSDVSFNGVPADTQFIGYFFMLEPPGQQAYHLSLALGEAQFNYPLIKIYERVFYTKVHLES